MIPPVHGRRRNVLPYYTPVRAVEQGRVFAAAKALKWRADTEPYHFPVTTRLAGAKAWLNIAVKIFAGGRPHDFQCAQDVQFRPRRNRGRDPRDRAGFLLQRDRPARRRDRPQQPVSARSLAENWRARPARHYRGGGIWRRRPRLSRALSGS